MNKSRALKIVIPIVALLIGATVGLGIGNMQIQKEQERAKDKIQAAFKKTVFIQKKMAQEKNQAALVMQQQCQDSLDKLEGEKQNLRKHQAKDSRKIKKLEAKIIKADETIAMTRKNLQEMEQKKISFNKEMNDLTAKYQALQVKLKMGAAETKSVQAEMKKTLQNLEQCRSNNADLCIIAEELVKKYRNKGVGEALLQKEPMTQIEKVKIEEITQQYREEIEHKTITVIQ